MSGAWDESDLRFMHEAIDEAKRAAAGGEIPVGCVAVTGGEVISRGHNRSIADHDPSGHAEIVTIRDASRISENHRLNGVTLYVTLEPCVMCTGAMIQARIQRLVFGAYDDKAGAAGSIMDLSDDRRLNHRFEVNGGLLEAECAQLLQQFFANKRFTRRSGSDPGV